MNYERTEALKDFVSELIRSRDTKLQSQIEELIRTSGGSIEYEAACHDILALLDNPPQHD